MYPDQDILTLLYRILHEHPSHPGPDPAPERWAYEKVALHVEIYRTYTAIEDGALRETLTGASYQTLGGMVDELVKQVGAGGGLVGPDMDGPRGVNGPRALIIAYRIGQLGATLAEGDRVRGLLAAAASQVFTALH
jgi:hypothetical protein